ncbi:MAG: class I SAM-dependent methyltransferase [Sulfolobales archaeon]
MRDFKTDKLLEGIISSLERIASVYDRMSRAVTLRMDRIFRSYVRDRAIGLKIIDIGAGTGIMYSYLEKALAVIHRKTGRVPIYVFVEPLDSYLNILWKRYRGSLYTDIVQGFAEHMPFRDDSIDTVISAFMLRDVRDLVSTLINFRRVSKKIVVLDFYKPNNMFSYVIELFYMSTVVPIMSLLYAPRHVKDYMYIRESVLTQIRLKDLLKILSRIFVFSPRDLKCWFSCIIYAIRLEKR